MKGGEPQSTGGIRQGIDVGSTNLGPKAPAVAEAEVIGDDDQEVRPGCHQGRSGGKPQNRENRYNWDFFDGSLSKDANETVYICTLYSFAR